MEQDRARWSGEDIEYSIFYVSRKVGLIFHTKSNPWEDGRQVSLFPFLHLTTLTAYIEWLRRQI